MESSIPEFGEKRENEERRDGGCAVVFDPVIKKYAVGKTHGNGRLRLFSGGVAAGEDMETGTLREVTEESGLYDFAYVENIGEAYAHYYNTLRKVNRVAFVTSFLIVLRSTALHDVQLEEHETFSLTWATAEEILKDWSDNIQNGDHDHWIHFMNKAILRLTELGYI